MKETYYVGFDPELKLWSAMPVTHDFDDTVWVYKVIARNHQHAMEQGLEKHRVLSALPSESEMTLIKHIHKHVGRHTRNGDETMLIELPTRMAPVAKAMVDKGYFMLAYQDEILLDMTTAGWKSMCQALIVDKKQYQRNEAFDASYA